jgi:hypothetical protein
VNLSLQLLHRWQQVKAQLCALQERRRGAQVDQVQSHCAKGTRVLHLDGNQASIGHCPRGSSTSDSSSGGAGKLAWPLLRSIRRVTLLPWPAVMFMVIIMMLQLLLLRDAAASPATASGKQRQQQGIYCMPALAGGAGCLTPTLTPCHKYACSGLKPVTAAAAAAATAAALCCITASSLYSCCCCCRYCRWSAASSRPPGELVLQGVARAITTTTNTASSLKTAAAVSGSSGGSGSGSSQHRRTNLLHAGAAVDSNTWNTAAAAAAAAAVAAKICQASSKIHSSNRDSQSLPFPEVVQVYTRVCCLQLRQWYAMAVADTPCSRVAAAHKQGSCCCVLPVRLQSAGQRSELAWREAPQLCLVDLWDTSRADRLVQVNPIKHLRQLLYTKLFTQHLPVKNWQAGMGLGV